MNARRRSTHPLGFERLSDAAGFTLIEVFVAAGLLALALMPVAYIQSSGLRSGSASYSLLTASNLAAQLSDDVRALPYTDQRLASTGGTYIVPDSTITNSNPLAADGTTWTACANQSCGYTRKWKITDNPTVNGSVVSDTKQIDVQVSWSEYGISRSFVVSTLKAVGS